MDTNYKSYKRYDDEFKRNAVELLESSGRSISEVSGDLRNSRDRHALKSNMG